MEKILNGNNEIDFDQLPIGLVKQSRETIRPKSFNGRVYLMVLMISS